MDRSHALTELEKLKDRAGCQESGEFAEFHRELSRILTLLREPPSTPWQPMASAPKDGREIVLLGFLVHGEAPAKGSTRNKTLRSCISRWAINKGDTPCYMAGVWCYSTPGYCDAFDPIAWSPKPERDIDGEWSFSVAPSLGETPAPPEETKEKDHGAELIGQPIPDMAGTEPRPTFWMGDENHAGRKVVVVSLKSMIKEWRSIATRTRRAYEGDYMRIPCEYFADAVEEAAFLLEKRLGAILEYPEAK